MRTFFSNSVIFATVIVFVFCLHTFDTQARSADSEPLPGPSSADSEPHPTRQVVDSTGGGGVQILNPLGEDATITSFFLAIIEILLIFAIPIIVLFIILAGFKFVTAQGNETKVGEAKRALLYAIVGGLLILGAFVILEVIQGTVASFQANS